MLYWGDWTFLMLIPVLLLAFYFQMKVQGTFKRYSRVQNQNGLSGAEMAARLLAENGCHDVKVESTSGMLSDHYDPRSKTVRLSEANYNGRSIAAITIAAHEVGHALQHQSNYAPLSLRAAIFPLAGIGSSWAFPLAIVGILFQMPILINVGIVFFLGAVLFHIVTLPVEFDASRRALQNLGNLTSVSGNELQYAREILWAAAMTYVAATLVSVVHLIRLLIIRNQFDD